MFTYAVKIGKIAKKGKGRCQMGKGIFITGTSTEIGKTFVTKHLTKWLREREVDCIAYKPIQTGCVKKNGELVALDVEEYIHTANLSYDHAELCTYFMEKPASPHLAAEIEGVEIKLEKIKEKFEHLKEKHELVFVEGAGGLAVPIKEADTVTMTKDIIRKLQIPILIVVPPHLGSINHTLLTVEYAKAHQLNIVGIIFNRLSTEPSIIEKDNMRMIEKLTQLPIIGRIKEASGELNQEDVNVHFDFLLSRMTELSVS